MSQSYDLHLRLDLKLRRWIQARVCVWMDNGYTVSSTIVHRMGVAKKTIWTVDYAFRYTL